MIFMKKTFNLVFYSAVAFILFVAGKKPGKEAEVPARPKLVIGIVVDQMRFDYLYRYWDKFGNDGFKRMITQGYHCRNVNFNYMPTYTGPGHASIFTGTTPSVHGIIGNSWFDRETGKEVYCVEDKSANPVGTAEKEGKRSPRKCITTTVGDQLQLSNNGQSKVIGIALKDRSAILPAGHMADGAYWFDGATGTFISSSFYMKELPKWVQDFNAKKLADKYLSQNWDTLTTKGAYTESLPDNNKYEGVFKGETSPVFPHRLPELREQNGKAGLIRSTPFGNTLTREFAEAVILGEQLGKGKFPDLLAISFSPPDYIGHMYGPQSKEIEDCYLKLDMELALFFRFIDNYMGKNNVLFFLTADHGAVENPQYLKDQKIPAGYFDEKKTIDSLKLLMKRTYSDSLIAWYGNDQLFFDHKKIAAKGFKKEELERYAANYFMGLNGVSSVITSTELSQNNYTRAPQLQVQNGYNFRRSGDVCVILEPGWLSDWQYTFGTTHGAPWSYDTHVPLYWWGWKIKAGSSDIPLNITDIAPSLSMFLDIQVPNGCMGVPISGMVK